MRIIFALMTSLFLSASLATSPYAAESDPLQVVVSLKDQHLKVFQGTRLITQSNISSGKSGNDTPIGVFSILQKNRHHRSNIYSNAPMPFMQRLTWSGIALHASDNVPAYPASHGCVRLPHSFASELFKLDTRGMHVVIEQSPDTPHVIEHRALFQPKKTWKTSSKLDPWVNAKILEDNFGFLESDHRYPARIFITRRTYKDDLFEVQRLLNKLGHNAGDVDGIMGPATWKAVKRFQEAAELNADGLIDSTLLEALYRDAAEPRPANGRVYVRKHHRTIYKAEIHITEPEKPLGSHLLTVSDYDQVKGTTGWLNVSLEDRVQEKINLKFGVQVDQSTLRQSVTAALDRVQMSKLDHEQISRFLSPGSSVTISDNGFSIETGAKGTDFIVLTKPQSNLEEVALSQ